MPTSLLRRPPDCDICQQQAREAAERDERRRLALLSDFLDSTIALLNQADRQAAKILEVVR